MPAQVAIASQTSFSKCHAAAPKTGRLSTPAAKARLIVGQSTCICNRTQRGGSDARIPLVAAVLPEPIFAPTQRDETVACFDPHDAFRHLVTKLSFHPKSQRRPVRDRQRASVHVIGQDRLRMERIDQVDGLNRNLPP